MARKWTGSVQLPFAKPKDLADNGQVFYIVGCAPRRKARGKFPEQIVFIIAKDTVQGERNKLTLSVAEDREALEAFVKEDPDNPVGPCKVEPIEADTPSGFYWVIESIEEEQPKGKTAKKR